VAADEAVLNNVHKKKKYKNPALNFASKNFILVNLRKSLNKSLACKEEKREGGREGGGKGGRGGGREPLSKGHQLTVDLLPAPIPSPPPPPHR
jgi:hypothetical protein